METLPVKLLKKGFLNRTIFVLGSTGSGKTVLIANLLRKIKRWILFDTRNEYSPEFFGNLTYEAKNVSELVNFLNEGDEKIIFKLSSASEESDATLEAALSIIYQFQSLNAENLPPVTIVLDELNRFADTRAFPFHLKEITQRGRDYGIEKIFGAQWFGTIPTWLRDSFSEIYAFRHSDPNGLKLLERFGFDSDEIKNLPLHVCAHNGKSGVETIQLVAESVE